MGKSEFIISISKAGEVTLEVRGVKGPRCVGYAEMIAEIVGQEKERRLTPEYYAPDEKAGIETRVHQT